MNEQLIWILRSVLTGLMVAGCGGTARERVRVERPPKAERGDTWRSGTKIELNYESEGDGDLSALFVHGFGASLRNWDDVRTRLRKDLRRIFVDLKGCGYSAKPDDGHYSPDDHAELLKEFIAANIRGHVVLIGHSYGGAIVLRLYQMLVDSGAASRVAAVILIDSAGYAGAQTFPLLHLRTPLWGPFLVNVVPEKIQAREGLKRAFFDRSKITDALVERYARFWHEDGWKRALIAAARQATPVDREVIIGRFAEVDKPTLIVWGSDDRIIPATDAERFRRAIRGSRVVLLRHCGHVPQEECPEETARVLNEFLGGVEQSATTFRKRA